ncbi:uncharacterized protein [Panulirus ornatus]|uniref:uncharacterized protein n=1 Tax=Panulirus ornatus TaxID=150431 RepID=UPI003A845981
MQGYLVPTLLVALLLVTLLAECRGRPQQEQPHHDGIPATLYTSPGPDGYEFEYQVVKAGSSWVESRGEWTDQLTTHGSYTVKLPDGRLQKVTYTADDDGFKPVITYEEPDAGDDGYGRKKNVGKKVEGETYSRKLKVDNSEKKEDRVLHDGKIVHPAGELETVAKSFVRPEYGRRPYGEDHGLPRVPGLTYDTMLRDPHSSSYGLHESHPTASGYQPPTPPITYLNTSPKPSPLMYPGKKPHPVLDIVEKYQHKIPGYLKHAWSHKSPGPKYSFTRAKTYLMNTPRPTHQPMRGTHEATHPHTSRPATAHSRTYGPGGQVEEIQSGEMYYGMEKNMSVEDDDMMMYRDMKGEHDMMYKDMKKDDDMMYKDMKKDDDMMYKDMKEDDDMMYKDMKEDDDMYKDMKEDEDMMYKHMKEDDDMMYKDMKEDDDMMYKDMKERNRKDEVLYRPLYVHDIDVLGIRRHPPHSSMMRTYEEDEESSDEADDEPSGYKKTTTMPLTRPFATSTYLPSSPPPPGTYRSPSTRNPYLPNTSAPLHAPSPTVPLSRSPRPSEVPRQAPPVVGPAAASPSAGATYTPPGSPQPFPHSPYPSPPHNLPYLKPHPPHYQPAGSPSHHLLHDYSSSTQLYSQPIVYVPHSPPLPHPPSTPPSSAYLHPLAGASEMGMLAESSMEEHH